MHLIKGKKVDHRLLPHFILSFIFDKSNLFENIILNIYATFTQISLFCLPCKIPSLTIS